MTTELRQVLRQVRNALDREDFDGARIKLRRAIQILDPSDAAPHRNRPRRLAEIERRFPTQRWDKNTA